MCSQATGAFDKPIDITYPYKVCCALFFAQHYGSANTTTHDALIHRDSSVTLLAQLVCAFISATGGIVVELWGLHQCQRLPLVPRYGCWGVGFCMYGFSCILAHIIHRVNATHHIHHHHRDLLHPSRLLSYQYLAFAGAAVYSIVDKSVFVLPVHVGLSLVAVCCVFDGVRVPHA